MSYLFLNRYFFLYVLIGGLALLNKSNAQKSVPYTASNATKLSQLNAQYDLEARYKNSDTAIVKRKLYYDPITQQYQLIETINGRQYRPATNISFEAYQNMETRLLNQSYFDQRAQTLLELNRRVEIPKLQAPDQLFNRLFKTPSLPNLPKLPSLSKDDLKPSIIPRGAINILMAYRTQIIKNPTISESARRNNGLEFDVNMNVSMDVVVGDKFKMPLGYNSSPSFNFNNFANLAGISKLDYKGSKNEIIKNIEAGFINWEASGTLMPSIQKLFGAKTELQFGRLFITAAIANQNSQRETKILQGGSIANPFLKKVSDYDADRHFLLAQYFKNNYNKAMSKIPVVQSTVEILRIDVWVTNRGAYKNNSREILGFSDLGEADPANSVNLPSDGSLRGLPANQSNALYARLTAGGLSSPLRNSNAAISQLTAMGLSPVNDYEKMYARKLTSSEYYYNPKIGFLSLFTPLQTNDVLAVAYQYTYNGRVYQVGEFAQDVDVDSTKGIQYLPFLKLLKATAPRTSLPIWQLMMKNVYSLDILNLSKEDFKLNILYAEPNGGTKRYLPESSTGTEGEALLKILKLDRLNIRNDPQPDGIFDYVEGLTVLPQQGKIIFPVLEPFGRDLETLAYGNMPAATKNQYLYLQLYDSIQAIAKTYTLYDKFTLQGQAKSTQSSQIFLGGFNIPVGSVRVTAAGKTLTEGVDYTVDYSVGTLKVLNPAYTNANIPLQVSFENNTQIAAQKKGFLGLKLNYAVNKKLMIGATMMRLTEKPFFNKVSYGEEPVKNTMYGLDFKYRSEWPGLTNLLNKIPAYATKAKSYINASGEVVYLKPGHSNAIGKGNQGTVYLDDFEAATGNIDLRYPMGAWSLSSTPTTNNPQRFPESLLNDSVAYNYQRARLAWYIIEPTLQDPTNKNNPLGGNLTALSSPYTRQIKTNELFPKITTNATNASLFTFDLAYYPAERGPYNYADNSALINAQGKLLNPQKNWGGITRTIEQSDFESNNIEYIEFWVLDPFINTPNLSAKGKLFLNLGTINEDILKDGKMLYENGLPSPNSPASVERSNWGVQPLNPVQITNAFNTDPAARPYQDAGLDGLPNNEERIFKSKYIAQLAANFGTNTLIHQQALNDPSNDDYKWYRDPAYDAVGAGILERYKYFNNPEGNSPIANANNGYSSAATLLPDSEDINKDNTLNQTESYFEYAVDLSKTMDIGTTKFLADKRVVSVNYLNGSSGTENWYLFRIPVKDYVQNVNNAADFKSIRYLRMYLHDFADSTVLRFASFDMVRNTWRPFQYKIDSTGNFTPVDNKNLTLLAVNVEENSSRQPVNYIMPPNVQRQENLAVNGALELQNEQSINIRVTDLNNGETRGVFKNMSLDMRQYGNLSMYVHAESLPNYTAVKDNELYAVMRIGQDETSNYYEIKIPLKITPPGKYIQTPTDESKVWPEQNIFNIQLQELVNLKLKRNSVLSNYNTIYREQKGEAVYSVFGNPNFGEIKSVLLGVENINDGNLLPLNTNVWFDELRLSNINEKGSYAATGRVDIQLADLGSISLGVHTSSIGFGTIEQKVNERQKDKVWQFDFAANLDLGKLIPLKKSKILIPVFTSINKIIRTPEYDPYDKDVFYQSKLKNAPNAQIKDSIKHIALDQLTISTLNFTNVRFQSKRAPSLFNLNNFSFSYSYTKFANSNPLVEKNDIIKHRFGLSYNYTDAPRYFEPFKKILKGKKSKWLQIIKEINFNLRPSLLSFITNVNRQVGIYVPRVVATEGVPILSKVDTTYDKHFMIDRLYNFRWDIARAINLDYSATSNAYVYEPQGLLNTKAKKDTVRRNFWQGGQSFLFHQKAQLSYTLPFAKFPLTDWIMARFSYQTSYSWIGASKLAIELGNTLENSQENLLQVDFDLMRLYTKSNFIKALYAQKKPANNSILNKLNKTPEPPRSNNIAYNTLPSKAEIIAGLTGKEKSLAIKNWRRQKRTQRTAQLTRVPIPNYAALNNPWIVNGMKLATMVKKIGLSYSAGYFNRTPGYMGTVNFMGVNLKDMEPGLAYVFGKQPDTNWLNKMSNKGLLSKDSNFNYLYRQTYAQNLKVMIQVEPVKDLLVDISFEKSFNKEYSELFKDTSLNFTGKPSHLNPYASGGFKVSYSALRSLFKKTDPYQISETFKTFENYRLLLSNRIAKQNPYYNGNVASDGYAVGYNRYAQAVLIPSFIAAYTGKSPQSVPLVQQSNPNLRSNPFSGFIPKPNWKFTYAGLNRIPFLSRIFSTFFISHGYEGLLSMNNYTSALLFRDPYNYGAPQFVDPISGNYIPYFLIPNITIQEQFVPLIGLDITTKKQIGMRFEYRKSRIVSLSLVDYQISETAKNEWLFGIGYRKRGFTLPFKLPGAKNKKLSNEIVFKLDIGIRDDITTNTGLDQVNSYTISGQKVVTITPNINYFLSNRVNIQLFYEQKRINPYVSSIPASVFSRTGVQVRINLAP